MNISCLFDRCDAAEREDSDNTPSKALTGGKLLSDGQSAGIISQSLQTTKSANLKPWTDETSGMARRFQQDNALLLVGWVRRERFVARYYSMLLPS